MLTFQEATLAGRLAHWNRQGSKVEREQTSAGPREPLLTQLKRIDARLTLWLPSDTRALMDSKTRDIERSGIAGRGLRRGDQVPDFKLPSTAGKNIRLSGLLEAGPVVLTFYRGGWSPYCSVQLRALQAALPEFERLGAQVVAISPEIPEQAKATARKLGLGFALLSDVGNNIARKFGPVVAVPEILRPVYVQFGIDIPAHNGDDSFELPLPATYLIDENGRVQYASVNADPRNRAEPADIVAAVARL